MTNDLVIPCEQRTRRASTPNFQVVIDVASKRHTVAPTIGMAGAPLHFRSASPTPCSMRWRRLPLEVRVRAQRSVTGPASPWGTPRSGRFPRLRRSPWRQPTTSCWAGLHGVTVVVPNHRRCDGQGPEPTDLAVGLRQTRCNSTPPASELQLNPPRRATGRTPCISVALY